MDQALKQRLVGAVVLIALAVIFLPVFVSGPQQDRTADEAEQILVPPAPESQLSSKRLPVIEDGSSLSREPQADAPQWPIEASPATDSAASDSVDDSTGEAANTLDAPAASHVEAGSTRADDQVNDQDNASSDDEDWLQNIPRTDAATDSDNSTAAAAADDTLPESSQTASAEPAATTPAESTADPAPTAPQLSATGPDPAQWHVQVASLGNPDNVRRLQQQLQGLSMPTITERVQRGDSDLYRVVIGPYADQTAAQQALQRIAAADQRLRPVLLEPEGVTAAPEQATPSSAATPQGLDRYAVQVGVFSTRERSEEVVQSLQDAGFAAYQETIERASETLYRVRIGPLLSEQDGINIAARIKRDLNLDSMVVDYR